MTTAEARAAAMPRVVAMMTTPAALRAIAAAMTKMMIVALRVANVAAAGTAIGKATPKPRSGAGRNAVVRALVVAMMTMTTVGVLPGVATHLGAGRTTMMTGAARVVATMAAG